MRATQVTQPSFRQWRVRHLDGPHSGGPWQSL